MHITSVKHEEVHYFTTTRWNTYRTSLQTWLGLESRDMAENFKHCVDVEFENILEDAGFHHTCYRRFTDKKSIAKVERRLPRERQEATEDHETIPSTSSGTSPTKKLRSRSGLPIACSGPVLPALCIICQKREKFIYRAGKRQRDPLSKAETLTAGKHTHTHCGWVTERYNYVWDMSTNSLSFPFCFVKANCRKLPSWRMTKVFFCI